MGYECDSANGLMKFVSRAKFTADIAIRQISRDFSEVSGDSIDQQFQCYMALKHCPFTATHTVRQNHILFIILRHERIYTVARHFAEISAYLSYRNICGKFCVVTQISLTSVRTVHTHTP